MDVWRLVPVIKALEPNAVQQVVAEKWVTLDSRRREWSVRLAPGWFERASVVVSDHGRKVGKYVRIEIIREGVPTPDFDIRLYTLELAGAWRERTNPGLTRYDPDLGVYAVDVDFSVSPHPIPQPYFLKVGYPSRREVEDARDAEALANYGSPVTVHAAYAAWGIEVEPFINAFRKILLPLAELQPPVGVRI